MLRSNGAWKTVSWDEAIARGGRAVSRRRIGKGVALMTGHAPGSLAQLCGGVAGAARAAATCVYEPFALRGCREANAPHVRAVPSVPHVRRRRGALRVSFGADFLETWLAR